LTPPPLDAAVGALIYNFIWVINLGEANIFLLGGC